MISRTVGHGIDRLLAARLSSSSCFVQLLLEEFGKYAAGRQAYFANIYDQVRP
jgi:hypothetical protein